MASGYSDLSEIRKDSNTYAAHYRPPKINLLNEKPRRESVIERQLTEAVTRPTTSYDYTPLDQQQVRASKQQVYGQGSQYVIAGSNYDDRSNYVSSGNYSGSSQVNYRPDSSSALLDYSPSLDLQYTERGAPRTTKTTTTRALTTTTSAGNSDNGLSYQQIEAELEEKKARLQRELAYLNQHQSPWSRPRQIREPRREPPKGIIRRDQKWSKECPSAPISRPSSRASSTRSTTEEDLLRRVEGLLQDAEEMEKKPLNKQQILIESGARKHQPTSSREQDPRDIGSIHTAIIKVPRGEVNNKSPLPFAYDNFSTLGVRGNIASVGAAEPDTPYPPIYPTIKRTPSPAHRFG